MKTETQESSSHLYSRHINKQWARMLDILGMNVQYKKCLGTKLWTEDGACYTDFLSGYCVQNIGHNNPHVIEAVRQEIGSEGPLILQSLIPRYAGELATKLVQLAGGKISHVCFCNTGSETVETAMKFARLHTKRSGILYSFGAFHGISYGAMSLMKHTKWVENFGPFVPDTTGIQFMDLQRLEQELKTKKYAAFITEAIQSEAGLNLPTTKDLQKAQELCRHYGTLFVVDEVQSGIFRTGEFLASHYFEIEPDMVLLAKALGGGVMPVGATLMSQAINQSVYKSIDNAFIGASTFSENALSMRASLATLEYIQNNNLAQKAQELGESLRRKVNKLVPRYEMLKEVRGVGLMNGVEFCPPQSLKLKTLFKAFKLLHPGLFGQMIVRHMFHNGHILTQVCGNNYLAIKACPALIASEDDVDLFVTALDQTLESFHSGGTFSEGLAIGKSALGL